MAPDMHHTGKPLPKPRPGSKPVRAVPRIGGVVFHAIALGVMLNGWSGLQDLALTEYVEGQVGGHFQFLTINGLFLAMATMAIGGLADMIPGLGLLRTLKRSVLLIALPLGVVISGIYWSLLLLAPSLILPPAQDQPGTPTSSKDAPMLERIPLWIDLSLHAVPAVALFIDFYFRERKYRAPVSTWGAFALSAIAAVSYASWVEYCASFNGTFPYPFLTHASFPVRIAIYAGATAFALGSFKVLNGLHA